MSSREQRGTMAGRATGGDGDGGAVALAEHAADPRLAYEYLLKLSMIASLRRAAELG